MKRLALRQIRAFVIPRSVATENFCQLSQCGINKCVWNLDINNGFKPRENAAFLTFGGLTYTAWAEHPFKTARAR